jgi:hypothetical protein
VLARLEHENIEVVREAARALGPIGDPSAVAPLLDLIHKTRNPAIALAAAESLGRLGDLSAVYEILPRMRTAATPMARRAFAASVGDLLGERDDFYRILIEEEQSHGAGMAPLFQRMRADWRRLDAVGGNPALSQEILRQIAELDARYEAREVHAAATIAFQIAIRLAERCHGVRHTGDSYAFLESLNKADPRFAAAVWYLAVLDGVFQRSTTSAALGAARDVVEIQLAIYILSSWSHQFARGRTTRDKREGTRVRGG